MKKTLCAALVLTLAFCTATRIFAADDVTGLWKTIDDVRKLPAAIMLVYRHDGMIFSRILIVYDEKKPVIIDTIETKTKKATHIVGDPPYCGLDVVYNMVDTGERWTGGKVMDPDWGREYDCVMWMEKGNLKIHGRYLIFGRTQTWYRADPAEFPPGFEVPDPATLVPVIPRGK